MDLQENGEQVYQYYTIVNDSTGESDEHKSIIYLTFDQNEGEEDEPMVSVVNDVQDNEAPDVSNIKVITFSDGEIYVSNTAPDDLSLERTDLMARNSDQLENDLKFEAEESNNEQSSDNLGPDYQQIKLEDGTCAIIDKKLWNSIVESATSKAPENPKKNKKFPCMYIGCNKVYSTAHHLTVHIRNHTGCRPYQCTIDGCDKAFSTGYSLKAHLRTHTGEKPYACNSCIKQFKTSGDLQKHVRTHTGEKPFKCPIDGCGRSFTTSNIRKVHIRSHTGERPYVCEKINCGKAFSSATNYKNHMRIHSGEKPYVCLVTGCDKRFTEYSSLYKHNMVHKPSKPFKCNYCGQTCKQDSTLKAHKRSIHNIIITDDGTEIIVKKEDQFAEVIVEISEQTESEFIETSEYN